jgi:uncharacterized protein (DUF58 family)
METPETRQPHQVPWLFGGYGLLGLLVATLVSASLSAFQVTLLAGALLLLGASGRLWSAASLAGLIYRRQTSPLRAFRGDTITLETSLSNRKLLPLTWVEVWEQLPLALGPGGDVLRSRATPDAVWICQGASLGPYQRARWQHPLHCKRRGVFTLGAGLVRSGDPFGICERQGALLLQQEVVVYPAVVPLRQLALLFRHAAVDVASRRSLATDPTRTAGLREYRPGDPQRLIHWRASAHAGELQVRILEETSSLQVTLLLDVGSFELPLRLYRDTLFELTLSALASIAIYLQGIGCPVGLFTSSLPPRELLPAANVGQLEAILEALARVEPEATELDWSHLLVRLPRRSTVVLACADSAPELATTVARLHHAGHRVLLLLAGSDRTPSLAQVDRMVRITPGMDLAAALEGRA